MVPIDEASYKNAIENATDKLIADIKRHILYTLGNDYNHPRTDTCFTGLAYSVRDRLIERWLKSQRSQYDQDSKRVYYLSMEFLPGSFLENYITNLDIREEVENALDEFGLTLEEIDDEEWDAGLGNGGLGRLASCFMDSMATLNIPGYGYGLRYEYGIFFQMIENGYQVEHSDNWVRNGCPWEIARRGFVYKIEFYGRAEAYKDIDGSIRHHWVDTEHVMAMPTDILIPGYGTENVNNMRLWSALSSRDFDLAEFNQGDYVGAMESKVLSENISKVLYPSDEKASGRTLRLKQQYFLVSATFQDIMRRFKKRNEPFEKLPDRVCIQLNDTHPTIAIAELMRLLVDIEEMDWDEAWNICVKTFSYTNHTVLPEALETWSVDLISKLLPRHMQIIYEINHRFLDRVRETFPEDAELPGRVSIIAEGYPKRVRMAYLAIVGSHAVNGVAALHSDIIKKSLFRDFDQIFPGRLMNVTNGITPRRWLLQCNRSLSELITNTIGEGWVNDLSQLKKLLNYVDDKEFRDKWRAVRVINKRTLASYIFKQVNVEVDPHSMFDVHVKRIHEYKRQLLNVLHVITLYNRIQNDYESVSAPRTIIFAGKAAPAYYIAKLIIKLINSVADVINNDPQVNTKLKVVFLPNYCVSQAEKLIPAADLSEQISTAGFEASGTGNMKFALNGALTIGTLDGANIEILEEVGEENMFVFGLNAEEVVALDNNGYNPYDYVKKDGELKRVLNLINQNHFCPENPGLFQPIIDSLLEKGDRFKVLADYRSYVDMQEEVSELYHKKDEWIRRSIMNTANMGKFSSDRAIKEYAENIWHVKPLKS